MQDFIFQKNDNGRVSNPYSSALFVCENNDGYYSITIPLEGIPTVYGDEETFDYNILTERTKGLTKGKVELTTAETDFFWTKENCNRLDQLKGKILPYMQVFGNGMAVIYNAEISYRPNDIENSDNLKGTLSITPSSIVGDVIYDCRGYLRETLKFAGVIPKKIVIPNENAYKLDVVIANDSAATVTATIIDGNPNNEDISGHFAAEWASGILTITPKTGATAPDYCMVRLDATDTTTKMEGDDEHNKYAPTTLFIDIEYAGEAVS